MSGDKPEPHFQRNVKGGRAERVGHLITFAVLTLLGFVIGVGVGAIFL